MAARTLYKPEYVELARKFCLLGATDIELADLFNVSVGALAKWKKAHPEFAHAVAQGKDIANAEVASKLYRRAIGYSHPETDIRVIKGELIKTVHTKHYAPDTVACIFWLKNRDKSRWRDKHETEHTGNVTYNNLTDDELDHKIKQLKATKPE